MDWSRTKSIFIAVFLILNIFLYSLYLNRYNEAQSIEISSEKTIDARLKEDNITYGALPNGIETATYILGKVHTFTPADFANSNHQVKIVDGKQARVILANPVKLRNVNDDTSFIEFVQTNIKEGDSYGLWNVNRNERVAIFFQKTNNRLLYYNKSGLLKIQWNTNNEVTMYEQTMLDSIEEVEREKNVFPPIQVIQALYAKNLLKPESRIVHMQLGYSTLVYLTKTQVLLPTWEVRVKLSDGDIEEYFVDALEGEIIEIQKDKQEVEEDWGV